ncbi:MAG: PKD domain-containing protein [Bacteroidetes bacterium]|nr:PKD domain-containing protein [Bacteroidota bacterium]
MKKILLVAFIVIAAVATSQTISSAIVPQFIQGKSTTNNERVPFYFWAEISGLIPDTTYRYYTTIDTLNSSPSSNGAGNPILINALGNSFLRSTSLSVATLGNYDSLKTDSAGVYKGWFGLEPTGNDRFTPGKFVYPQININDGMGGNSVATRIKASSYLVRVVNFGNVASDTLQCSSLIDSVTGTLLNTKDFALLYDNTAGSGRPISIAVIEKDGIVQKNISSYIQYYRDVDTIDYYWATIIPNKLPNGIQRVEFRTKSLGASVAGATIIDNDGVWCSGLSTINPRHGSTSKNLKSLFILNANASIPSSIHAAQNLNYSATANTVGINFLWNFGDATSNQLGASTNHTYTTPGSYTITLVASNSACADTSYFAINVGANLSVTDYFQKDITVFPNPSSGVVSIKTNYSTELNIVVLNILGEAIGSYLVKPNVILSVTIANKGLYTLVGLDSNGGVLGAKKLLIE